MSSEAHEHKEFAIEMQKVHDQIKEQLQDSNLEIQKKRDRKRREVHFEVGDQVISTPEEGDIS
jgi:hypothetical protein